MITIIPATATDYKTIQDIAHQTWPIAYGEILSTAQLDFMLDAFYNEDALKDSVLKKRTSFCIG